MCGAPNILYDVAVCECVRDRTNPSKYRANLGSISGKYLHELSS